MATPTIPNTEPTSLVRGDSTKWTRAFSEYLPADGWALTYYFVNVDNCFSVTATNNGDGSFLVTIATTDSAKFIKGLWSWQAVVTKTTERITLRSGAIEILDGFATAAVGVDARSWARRALDEIEAAILTGVSRGQTSMSIGGRSVSWASTAELFQLRNDLRNEVAVEEQGASAGIGRHIRVRYANP